MHSVITSVLVRSGCGLLLGLMCAATGCSSDRVLYVRGHAPIALPSRPGNYENPDNYRVNSSEYPSYAAKYNFSPPKPHDGKWVSRTNDVKILTTDIWQVTHKIGDTLILFSKSYQDRQCDYLLTLGRNSGAFKSPLGGGCNADNLYEIYASPDGRVIGWLLLNNTAPSWSKERYTIMAPASRESLGWPKQSLFAPVHQRP